MNVCLQVIKVVEVSWATWPMAGSCLVPAAVARQGMDAALRVLLAARDASAGGALLVLCFGRLKAELVSREFGC